MQWRELFRAPMKLPRSRVPLFLSQELAVLEAESEVDANFGIDEFTLEPQSPRFILALNGGLVQVQAQLQCAYGPRIMTVGVTAKDESLWLPDPRSTTRYSTRDFAPEVGGGADAPGGIQRPGRAGALELARRERGRAFSRATTRAGRRNGKFRWRNGSSTARAKNFERLEPRFQIRSSGERWFDVEMSLASSDGEKFSTADIQRLILSGTGHTRLKMDGSH